MKSLTKFFNLNPKKIILFVFIALLVVLVFPERASAFDLLGIGEIAISAINSVLAFIGSTIAFIIGIFVTIATWLAVFALSLNEDVVSSGVVQVGMQITSSLANLGFIFILIVIAIATILRRQSYGVKQLLAKLIIAALLVNFSLLIAGAILNTSNVFTEYFLSAMPGHGGGVTDFALDIGNAFSPQALALYFLNSTSTAPASQAAAYEKKGNSPADLLMSVTNVFFAIFFSLAILITILALATMLLIRYVYIVILLILMPLAWITWIAPLTSNLWQKWWNHFIHWAFFPPIMMMFLYIAFHITAEMSSGRIGEEALSSYGPSLNNSLPYGLQGFTVIGDEIALIGLVIGGLIAANSMGITGANKALGITKGIGKSLGNYTKNKARQGLSRTYNAMGGQRLTNALINSRIPGLNRLGTALNQATVGSNTKIIDEQIKELDKAKLNPEQLAALVGNKSASMERRLAALSKLDSSNNLSALKQVPVETMHSLLKEAENRGQGELANKVDKQAFGMYKDPEYANNFQELANKLEQAKSANDTNEARKILDQINTLIKDKMEKDGYSPQDIEKGFKEFFNGDSFGGMSSTQMQNIAQGMSSAVLDQNPKILSNIIKNSNIKDMKKITNNIIVASATRTGILSPNDVKDATVGSQMFRYDLIPALNNVDKDFKILHQTLIKQGLKRLTNT